MQSYDENGHDALPGHINDRNGTVSMFLLALVIVLLVVLIIALAQAA